MTSSFFRFLVFENERLFFFSLSLFFFCLFIGHKEITMADKAARPAFTKPSRFIAAAKAGEDNLIEEYLDDKSKNIDVNKV